MLLADGQGVIGYTLPANTESTSVVIKDSSGKAIRTVAGEKTTGTHAYIWDGRTDGGVKMADGTYTFEVTAKDAAGKAVTVSTQFAGTVTGVTNSGGTVVLNVGVLKVPLSDVTGVRTPKASDTDTDTIRRRKRRRDKRRARQHFKYCQNSETCHKRT